MSDAESKAGDLFNVERLKQLAEIMDKFDLSEVDLRQDDKRLHLRRGAEKVIAAPAVTYAPPAAAPVPAPAPTAAAGPPAPAGEAPAEDGEHISIIRSPMVGTFYSRPNPNAENYVKVGDMVGPETTVCIIEAMKTFSEIQAEIQGRIVAVLVQNEEPVDVNKPLFKVDTSATG